eukprot:1161332-Pelagomonas_calceolata.AAC.13
MRGVLMEKDGGHHTICERVHINTAWDRKSDCIHCLFCLHAPMETQRGQGRPYKSWEREMHWQEA